MKSFRNLFRSKKEEKEKESNVQCNRIEHNRLPPAIKAYPKPPPSRLFADDMNIYNPSAAYHTNIQPAVRRPLRSCPGDVAPNRRNRVLSDSDDDDIPLKPERRRLKYPKSHYGDDRKIFTSRTKFESKETSEYGSEDHSPISNALKFGGFESDSYYPKYRKYKNRAIELYEQNKKFQDHIRHLECQLKTSNQRKNELSQQVDSLKRQLHNAHNYSYTQPQYPSYYSQHHHQQQQQFSHPPHSGFPPLPPPPLTFSTAPTIPLESDEVKTFRRQDTDSKPLSPDSFSSTSLSHYGNFKPDMMKLESRMNSTSLFGEERENSAPSFNDNF